MANLQGFDATQHGEMLNFDTLPAMKAVLAMMTASEMQPNKAGNGSFLKCEFTLLQEGQYKGRKLWARLNLSNPNKQAEDIAQRELAAICKAVGMPKPNDSADLHNRPMLIDIDVEKGSNGNRDQNRITKYVPATAAGSFAAPPPPSAGTAVMPTPAATPQPTVQPAVAPWLRK